MTARTGAHEREDDVIVSTREEFDTAVRLLLKARDGNIRIGGADSADDVHTLLRRAWERFCREGRVNLTQALSPKARRCCRIDRNRRAQTAARHRDTLGGSSHGQAENGGDEGDSGSSGRG